MVSPLTHLGDMPVKTFIDEYWQKKPLLIKNALPEYSDITTGDTLAGLSLEDGVVSRLIQQTPQNSDATTPNNTASHWEVTHGPIDENVYSTLPNQFWTLLVQHADQLLDDVNELKQLFKFLPSWRLDDVMISYSTDGAGVGPHYDYYDVFLLQGEGKRRWRTGQHCHANTPLDPNAPMKVLQNFETENDWIVTPGDLLYIPPQCAHWGEAIGESITYSVGFRSPSHQDILLDYAQHISESLTQDKRFTDPTSQLHHPHKSEITHASIKEIQNILHHYANNPQAIAAWLGNTMTQPNPGIAIEHEHTLEPDTSLNNIQHSNIGITLSSLVKAAFYTHTESENSEKSETSDSKSNSHAYLFINGEHYPCDKQLAHSLCNHQTIYISELKTQQQNMLNTLLTLGYLIEVD